LTHNAARILSTSDTAALEKVKAVVVFGDPDNGIPIEGVSQSIVKTYCNSIDLVCSGGFFQTAGHTSYWKNATNAAEFIREKISVPKNKTVKTETAAKAKAKAKLPMPNYPAPMVGDKV
jgi:Cutinase